MAEKKPPAKKKSDSKPAPRKPAGPPQGDPMATGTGVQPPPPGGGIDPYAALAGMISNTPPPGQPAAGMGMPMGMGAGGQTMPGGGPGGGMGMGIPGAGQEMGPPGGDPMMQALMSSGSPMSLPPDTGGLPLGPQPQEQLSVEQLLTLLSMMQGGLPSSGMTPNYQPGSTMAGVGPSGVLGV